MDHCGEYNRLECWVGTAPLTFSDIVCLVRVQFLGGIRDLCLGFGDRKLLGHAVTIVSFKNIDLGVEQ